MKDDNMRDVFVWGPAILVAVALCVLFTCLGCSSVCPPPKVETVEVNIPVYSCPEAQEVPQLVLPDFPVLPDGFSEEQSKDWYAEMVSVAKARHKILLARIQALEEMLDQYRGD